MSILDLHSKINKHETFKNLLNALHILFIVIGDYGAILP